MVSPPISAYLCVTGSLRDSGMCSVVWNVASHTTGAPGGSWLLLHPVLMCLSAFRNCYFAQLWECECKVFVPRSPLVRAEWLLLHWASGRSFYLVFFVALGRAFRAPAVIVESHGGHQENGCTVSFRGSAWKLTCVRSVSKINRRKHRFASKIERRKHCFLLLLVSESTFYVNSARKPQFSFMRAWRFIVFDVWKKTLYCKLLTTLCLIATYCIFTIAKTFINQLCKKCDENEVPVLEVAYCWTT